MTEPDPSALITRIGVIHLTWKRFLQRRLDAYQTNLKQLYLLRQLRDRQYLYPADVAEMLYCDRPTATAILNTMQRRGWITRRRDPDSGRRVQIRLASAGRRKLQSIPVRIFRTEGTPVHPLSCLSDSQLRQFDRLLMRVEQHVKELPHE